MPILLVYLEGHEVLRRELAPGEYILGRAEDADVLLDDPRVAERHARLVVSDQGLVVEDLSSTATLLVDDQIVSRAEPAPGQSVWIASFELKWEAGPAPAPEERTVVVPAGGEEFTDEATVVLSAEEEAPEAVFTVREGNLPQDSYRVRGRAVVGRAADCDLVLPVGTVSRRHAEIVVTPQGVTVRDLGSTSGTLVNGRKIQEAALTPGDRLRLGEVVLELAQAPGQAAAAPPPPPKAAAPTARQPAPQARGGSRRPLLYGAAAVAVLIVVVAFFLCGGRGPQPPAVERTIAQSQAQVEDEQKRRLVVINLTKARQAMALHKYLEAKVALQAVLAVDPKNPEAAKLMQQADQALAAAEEARRRAEQEAEARARKAAELMDQVEAAYQAQDWARVVELGKQALTLNPKDATARRMVMEAQAALEMAECLRREEEQTAARRQELAAKLLAQAKALAAKGKLLAAREALQRLAQADPQGTTPSAGPARKLLAQVEPKIKARADKEYRRGIKALKRGRLEKAVTALTAALAADPGHQAAAKALAKARKKAAKLAQRLYEEGKVHASLGQQAKACRKWRRALRLTDQKAPLYAKLKSRLAANCKK